MASDLRFEPAGQRSEKRNAVVIAQTLPSFLAATMVALACLARSWNCRGSGVLQKITSPAGRAFVDHCHKTRQLSRANSPIGIS